MAIVKYSIALDEEIVDALISMAIHNDTTVAKLVTEWLNEHREGNKKKDA